MAKRSPGDWNPVAGRPSGYRCSRPVFYEARGEVYKRDCGNCDRCIAAKKRDVVGRAAAEASTADEVIFFTLTYRPGEVGAFEWVTKDRQGFLKRLRAWCWDEARRAVGAPVRYARKCAPDGRPWKEVISAACKRVRYFGAGEVGQRSTKRNHWHVVVFVTGGRPGPSGWKSTPRGKDGRPGREHIKIWPHGHVHVDVLRSDMADRVSAIRYCAVYLHKTAKTFVSGGTAPRAGAVMFRSLKPCLGAEFLRRQAARYVEAGLPLPGYFQVNGVQYSRGFCKGQLVRCHLSGAARREWVDAYKAAFAARRGVDEEIPDSPFLRLHDPDYIARPVPKARRKPLKVRASRKSWSMPPKPDGLSGLLMVYRGAVQLGLLQMLRNGVCVWQPESGPSVRVADDLAAFDDVVREWVAARRGPDWLSPEARWRGYEARRVERVQALARAFAGKVAGSEVPLEPLTAIARKLRLEPDLFKARPYRPPSVETLLRRERAAEVPLVRVGQVKGGKMDDDVTSRGLWPVQPSRGSTVTAAELAMLSEMSVPDQLAWHDARERAAVAPVKIVAPAPVAKPAPVQFAPQFYEALRRALTVAEVRAVPMVYESGDKPRDTRAGARCLVRLARERLEVVRRGGSALWKDQRSFDRMIEAAEARIWGGEVAKLCCCPECGGSPGRLPAASSMRWQAKPP